MNSNRHRSRRATWFRTSAVVGLLLLAPLGCNRAWRRVDGMGMAPQPRVGGLLPRLRGHDRTFQDPHDAPPVLASQPQFAAPQQAAVPQAAVSQAAVPQVASQPAWATGLPPATPATTAPVPSVYSPSDRAE